jgi:hypothetical protein
MNERVFTPADVKQLFQNHKKRIRKASFLGALLVFGATLILTPPKYQILATFREASHQESLEVGNLRQLIMGEDPESNTMVLIQSNQVLKPLIEKVGLQASVARKGLLAKVVRRVKENILAEMGFPLSDVDWFAFEKVEYPGEWNRAYGLRFDDPLHFSILSGKQVLATGSIGSEVRLPEVSFTLVKAPQKLKLGVRYTLSFQPWAKTVQGMRARFSITTQKSQKSIFELKFFHRDRHFGAATLNSWMEEYRNYLKRDHDELVHDQLSYLEQKQGEITKKMSIVFDEYTEYLKNNLTESGQVGFSQEIEGSTKEYQETKEKVVRLELELEQLRSMNFVFSDAPKDILKSIGELSEMRDVIELSLPLGRRELGFDERKRELKELRNEKSAMQKRLDEMEFDPKSSLTAWASSLEGEDLALHLQNSIRLLSMQEKMICSGDTPSEFRGIDLKEARLLFKEYNNQLDESAATMNQLALLGAEMGKGDFEISSLSAVLPDALSQKLIGQASEIAIKLKDVSHHSEKEENRWKEELSLQKKILKNHLDQLGKLEHLKSDMIRGKIERTQALSLSCITGQISVLQERLIDWVKDRKSAILEEKRVLDEKIEQMRSNFSSLPEKWRREKWLELKTGIGIKMIQALTELTESKTIGSELHHIESKPLDPAFPPTLPKSPGLLIKTFLGALIAGLGLFSRFFLKAALLGFPSSKEKLMAHQLPFLGEISPHCDGPLVGGDLEIARKMRELIGKTKVTGLILGKGPDYSYMLAEHLARVSKRALIVRCDFNMKFSKEDQPGLLQLWKKEIQDPPIRHRKEFDLLPSGGYTPYGTEVVKSDVFQTLLKTWQEQYDAILLVFRASLDSVESFAPLALCDRAIVTASGELTEQLTPFIDWAYHEGVCRLAFLTVGFK